MQNPVLYHHIPMPMMNTYHLVPLIDACFEESFAIKVLQSNNAYMLCIIESIDTHTSQNVENLIGYHNVDHSLEDVQKWN